MPDRRRVASWRLLAATLPAATIPCLGSLVYFVFFSGETWARWVYLLVKLFTLVWPLVALPALLGSGLPRIDWGRRAHRAAIGPGLALGALALVATAALMATPFSAILAGYADQIRHKVAQLGVLEHYVAFGLFLSLVHSGLEEYYWRWFLFGSLRRHLPVGMAMVLASLAFASHHAVILSQYVSWPWALVGTVAVALGGVVWCLMYQRQKTLVGAWLSHALVDVAVLWVGYRLLF